MKRLIMVVALLGILLIGGWLLFGERVLTAAASRQVERNISGAVLNELPDGLHLILCGAGAPLPDPTRAGPCVLVLAGQSLYVVDVGSGATRNFGPMGIPVGKVDALFLTHFHSDHIDGMGELMTLRWAGAAHDQPLPVYGPPGVSQIVRGFNMAYAQDFRFRVDHHGEAVVPPGGAGAWALPFRLPQQGESVKVLSSDDLTVHALAVEHEPVHPAVGYRFDYKGRSLLISGDTRPSENLQRFAEGVDLLVHEALAPQLVEIVGQAAQKMNAQNLHKITLDILDYHTTPVQAARIAAQAGARHLLFYHLVPPLPVRPMERMFVEGVDEVYDGGVTVGRDGTLISLPAGSSEIRISGLL